MVNKHIPEESDMVSNSIVRNILLVTTGFLIATVLALAIGLSVTIKSNYQETQKINSIVAARVHSLCGFFQPLVPIPPQANSSKAGVQLLEGSRLAYLGLGCISKLPPPTTQLVNEGKKFNIPIK